MSKLRISLLGGIRVNFEESPSSITLSPSLQLLLAHIVFQRHTGHTRLFLVDRFWPEYGEKRAQRCLRTALWRLRRALVPPDASRSPYLLSDAHKIEFNFQNSYWLDVEQFETGLAQLMDTNLTERSATQLESTLALYTGNFLNGHYDDWIIVERERLENLYVNGLHYLMQYYGRAKLYEEGIVCGQKILKIDEIREEIHRELMRVYALTGRRPQAIRQYNLCAEILDRELHIEPMPETKQLYQKILTNRLRELPEDGDVDTGPTSLPDGAEKRFQLALAQFEKAFHHLKQATAYLHNDEMQ